jgi:hypothetical protein
MRHMTRARHTGRSVPARLLACAAAGALLTLLSAWACTTWAPDSNPQPNSSPRVWPAAAPAGWPAAPDIVEFTTGFGRGSAIASSYGPSAFRMTRTRAGLPFPALQSVVRISSLHTGRSPYTVRHDGFLTRSTQAIADRRAPLPIRPLIAGFAADTAILGALVYALSSTPALIARAFRRKPGHCRHCGYDLQGITSPVCPECGN